MQAHFKRHVYHGNTKEHKYIEVSLARVSVRVFSYNAHVQVSDKCREFFHNEMYGVR